MNRRSLLNVTLALAVSIAMPGSVRAQTDDVGELIDKMVAAYEAEDWPTALEYGQKLVSLEPQSSMHPYNMACVYARSGESEKALKWLGRSVELGFSDGELLRSDADLDSLRDTEAFAHILRDFEARMGKGADQLEALIARNEPLILTPPEHDATQPAPVIVALHGFGVDAEDIGETWHGPAAHIGAVVVAPRAVRKAEGRDGFSWGPVDEAERIVLAALEVAKKKVAFDPERVVLTGFSQGGYMSLNLAARHPQLFRGVIPVAAFYRPEHAEFAPAAEGRSPRFYVMVGGADAGLESNRAAVAALESKGYDAKLVEFEGLGHTFPPERDVEMHKALHFVLD